jgi:hypothetical protein
MSMETGRPPMTFLSDIADLIRRVDANLLGTETVSRPSAAKKAKPKPKAHCTPAPAHKPSRKKAAKAKARRAKPTGPACVTPKRKKPSQARATRGKTPPTKPPTRPTVGTPPLDQRPLLRCRRGRID